VSLLGRALLACVLALAGLGWSASASAAPPDEQGPAGLQAPVLLNEASLEYPPELLELDEPPSGQVVIKYVVGTDGVPKELEVAQSVHPRLDELALEAVGKLRYEPAKYQGQAVEVVLSIGLDIEAPPKPEPEPQVEPPDGEDDEPLYEEEERDEGPVRISGVVLEAGVRTPLQGATVLVVPAGDRKVGRIEQRTYEPPTEPEWSVRGATDSDGRFELRGVPDGKVRLIILAQGFARLDYVVELPPGEALDLKYYQTRIEANPYKTTVEMERDEMPEVTRRTISTDEINSIPGTQGDALKGVQNFPGIARSPFGAGLLVIRGAAPGDSAIYLGYHEIPTLFHFGGITSVFNSDILTQIDFIPGNFDSRYGDAIGGVVNVVPRAGRRDGYHGYADVDLFDTTVMAEGPVGKGSFIVSGRRSYADWILNAVIPDDAGVRPTVAPRYWDYQGLFDYPLAGGELSVRVFGSDDRSKLLFSDANDVSEDERDRFETTQWFHRADLVYKKREGPWEFLVTPSYKHEFFRFFIGEFFQFDLNTDTFSTRAEIARQLSKRARLRVGTEVVTTWFNIDVRAPSSDGGPDEVRETKGVGAIPALYTTLTLGLTDRFTLYPGVRFSYYTSPVEDDDTEDRGVVDPRLRATWDVADHTTLKGGVGIYSQGPQPVETDVVFGNPALSPERSMHTSLGVAQGLPRDFTVEVTGFYKYLWDVVAPSEEFTTRPDGTPGPELYSNAGLGRIYGGELLLRKNLTKNFYGWLSYTLMRSEVQEAPGEPWILFNFDQTHILTLIASYRLPYNWQVGARFRLVSGNPTTPITDGVFDAATGSEIALPGPVNGARLPPFHQLDFRIDKTWIFRLIKVTFYLDIQNVYNAENAEFVNYSYDYEQKSVIAGLPTTPSLGTKIEF
jgi:TonB family protein